MSGPSLPSTPPMRRLAALLPELPAGLPRELEVSDLTLDSREASPGGAFLACRGRTRHGLEFARDAISRGARVVLWEPAEGLTPPRFEAGVHAVPVPRLSRRAGEIADRFFGEPSASLEIAGITGTNGKTTCAWLLAQALGACGRRAAYVGTLGSGLPGAIRPGSLTTADAVSVHRQLAQLRAAGAVSVAMEVSSHALDQDRVAAVRFRAAVFTNLTRDHLDYHGTMAAYGAAKARLFAWPTLEARIVNVDDELGRELASREGPGRLVVTTSGRHPLSTPAGASWVAARDIRATPRGLALAIDSSWGEAQLALPLIGRFNADNALSVLASLLALGLTLSQATAALEGSTPPPGRMEPIQTRAGGPLAIVDYAHTPDALAKALEAARAHCAGELWAVFGCGGDRDAGKRPLMGEVAARLADRIVLTDDNPRTEEPSRIVAQILEGVRRVPAQAAREVETVHDRAGAISAALSRARGGDVVLVAGKGHEDYQIYGRERRPFSDQAAVRAWAERAP